MPSQDPSLIFPNQLRFNGVTVHDLPCNLSPYRESPHSINIPINDLELVNFPLNLDGIISNLLIRFTTERKVEEYTELEVASFATLDPYYPNFKVN